MAARDDRALIPPTGAGRMNARRLRRRSVANLACMGHCAPAVLQTLLDDSDLHATWLVRASGGLPGGIGNTGNECGGVTAPLMLLGLRHAHDLERGVPAVVYQGHELLRQFAHRHGTISCREIRGGRRLPLRCINVVRHAAEEYARASTQARTEAIAEEPRQAFGCLHAHFVGRRFHCAQAVLRHLGPELEASQALLDAASAFAGGTVFTGRTCGALTAGVLALGYALGGIERSRRRVLRMIALMAVGGDAFADECNAFNRTMNLGNRLGRWFEEQFGSTQCHAITGCDFSTSDGVRAYIERNHVTRCIDIAARVARQVRAVVHADPSRGTSAATREA